MSWLSEMFSGDAAPQQDPYAQHLAQLQAQNAQAANARAQEQFDWARNAYEQDRAANEPVRQAFIDTSRANLERGQRFDDRYWGTYAPLEDQYISEAQNYATPGNLERLRGRAMAGVASSFEAERDNALNALQAYGIGPGVRYAALDRQMRTAKAAAQAAAGEQATLQGENTGRALIRDAAGMGQAMPGYSNAATATGTAAGTAGVNTGLATTSSGASTMGTGTQWGGLGVQGLNSASNAMDSIYDNQLNAWKAEQDSSTGLGTLAGMGAKLGMAYMTGGTSLMMAGGGAVPDLNNPDDEYGHIPMEASPSQGAMTDDIPARVDAGEFIFPRDVAAFYGTQKLYQMIEKARQAQQQGGEPRQSAIPA